MRDTMRQRFFVMYQTIKYKDAFFNSHYRRAYWGNLIFSATTLLVSIASALIWSVSNQMPALWAIVIAAAQLMQSLQSFMPWAKRLSALEHFQPDLWDLLLEIENFWNYIDIEAWNAERINSARADFDHDYVALEQKYIGSVHFPNTKRISAEATEETNTFFRNRYTI